MFGPGGARTVQTGGRTFTTAEGYLRAETEAAAHYDRIRATPSSVDVAAIARNTGMPEYRVQRIKEHVFFKGHTLESEGRVGRFAPYIEIADAWNRLQRGNFVKQDIDLLNHEYFESRFEGIHRTTADTAHRATVSERSGRIWDPESFTTTPDMKMRREF